MNRRHEVRELLSLTPEQVIDRAGSRLVVCDGLEELHRLFARMIADEIKAADAAGNTCRLILPVGPTGGYPHLARIVRREHVPLAHCRFFFMDEYCDESGNAVATEHVLSFKGVMWRLFFGPLASDGDAGMDGFTPDDRRIVFPDRDNIDRLAALIESGGGIDTCYGGVGIHGHVAFNEPEPGVAISGPRRTRLNDFTVTINAIRAQVGGDLENFPRAAWTLGMKQVLDSRRIVLFCRNDGDLDWANTVLRLALFGEPGDDYPVTHIRNRNYTIVTDRATLARPRNLL
jgi:glucosamine-6-phosphate deaminase